MIHAVIGSGPVGAPRRFFAAKDIRVLIAISRGSETQTLFDTTKGKGHGKA